MPLMVNIQDSSDYTQILQPWRAYNCTYAYTDAHLSYEEI